MSGIQSQYGISLIHTAENYVLMSPKSRGVAKPGIIYSHGAGELCAGFMTQPRGAIYTALVMAGYTVLSCDNGGAQTWGNDTAVGRIDEAYTFLQSRAGVLPGPVVVIGQSMGAQNSLIYTKTNPSKVKCCIGMIPVIDVTDIRTNNRGGLQATIDGCYSGGWSEATYGATKNPATIAAAGGYAGRRIQLWYGDTDVLCLPALAASFVSASGCEGHVISGGHAESTMTETAIPPASIISFIKAS